MRNRKIGVALSLSLGLLLFLTPALWAEMEIGNAVVSGEAEVGGLFRGFDGGRQKFEEYRDLPETVIVPQLQLMIGSKKNDFYLEFDSTKTGLDDQNYRLRFGRYGLLDVQFEWDQIPHLFSKNTARTPYTRSDGTYTLTSKPAGTAGTQVRDWINGAATPVDLKLLDGIARFNVRYTPTPGWTFTGGYSSMNTSGGRAFGAYFGPSPGSYNITELVEPLDYQMHNIELGGEYAGKGWSIGLKYQLSLFHNNVSTLVWDNPLNLDTSGPGGACTDASGYSNTSTGTDANRGPCRGRIDLYPSNRAHTFILSGQTQLPFKSHFMGTVSYGWRLQDDTFLPFTINPAVLATLPEIRPARRNLDGDVRPLMINATLTNRYFDRVGFKAYYRYYDYDNRSKKIFFPDGIIINDQGTGADAGLRSFPYSYSRQNIGLDADYRVGRWLSAKFGYLYENMHRERREVVDSNEHTFGPTFDITPLSWVLIRLGYKRSLRDAHDYDAGRQVVVETEDAPEEIREERLEELRKFDEAARNRDKFSFFAQVTPLENLSIFGGFDFLNDKFPRTVIGVKNDISYAPSIGFTYVPLEWMTLFGNYSWERFDWKMKAIERSSTAQNPSNSPARIWNSRGRDQINTVSFGTDLKLIKDLLGMRLQYTFSEGSSLVRASGDSAGTPATDYPDVTSRWHEFLARFDYQFHKNVGLRFGYYFNRFNEKDFGVDIMKVWMGDVDTGTNVQRSIFLGDRVKRPFTAHVGFVGLRFKF